MEKVAHDCLPMQALFGSSHPERTEITLVDERWFLDHEEYSFMVSYCPWCGLNLYQDERLKK